MLVALLAPPVLASLVLAAHFLRREQWLPFAICAGMAALAFVRRPWARRVWQGLLGIGVVVWLGTLAGTTRARVREGAPWRRPAVILGAVAGLTLASALLLEHRRLRVHFEGATGAAPPREG